MDRKSIVISGGTGFVGTHLAHYYANNYDMDVFVLVRKVPMNLGLLNHSNISIVKCEVSCNEELINRLPRSPEVFIHLAWSGVHAKLRNDIDVQIQNVNLAINAVKIAHSINAKKFFFPGSPLEYQDNNTMINQYSIPCPSNAYGAAKISARFCLAAMCERLNMPFYYAVISSIYSADRNDDNIISYVLGCLLGGVSPSLTEGKQVWDYVHIDDVVRGVSNVIEYGVPGKFYTIGAGDNWPLRKYIEIIHEIVNRDIPLGLGKIPLKNGIIPCAAIDMTETYGDTGYIPHITFADGINRVINEITGGYDNSVLNVMYQASDAYAPMAITSIYSLLTNNQDIDYINLIFLDAGLSETNIVKLRSMVNKFNRRVTIIPCNEIDRFLENAGVKKYNGSYATFYKLFVLDKIYYDKILYIDSDTLVEGSLKSLCNYEFEGKAFAMALSGISGQIKKFYGLSKWFNAGVIYFNVKLWKEKRYGSSILREINGDKYQKLTMIGDETLINSLFSKKIKRLELTFNYESTWWLWGWNSNLYDRLGFNNDGYYSKDEVIACNREAIINHYTVLTTGRPWDRFNDNRAKKSFKKYYCLAGFTESIDLYKGSSKKKGIVELFFMRLKRRLMPMHYRSIYGYNIHEENIKHLIDKTQKQL